MITRPPLPGPAHAALDFVGNEQDSMLAANSLQLQEKLLRRGHVPAFSLDRLDKNCGNFLRIDDAFEYLTLQDCGRLHAIAGGGIAIGAAIGIRVRDMKNSGQQGAEAFSLDGLRRSKRKRSERSPVEASVKRDDFV